MLFLCWNLAWASVLVPALPEVPPLLCWAHSKIPSFSPTQDLSPAPILFCLLTLSQALMLILMWSPALIKNLIPALTQILSPALTPNPRPKLTPALPLTTVAAQPFQLEKVPGGKRRKGHWWGLMGKGHRPLRRSEEGCVIHSKSLLPPGSVVITCLLISPTAVGDGGRSPGLADL